MNTDPDEFFRNSVPLLKCLQEGPGYTYVLVLLVSHGLLLNHLLKEDLFAPEELTAIARQLSKVDPQFGVKLLKSVLPNADETSTDPASVRTRLRLMEILESVSDGQRILPVMMRLLKDSDAKVRSKAALLAGRGNQSTRVAEECLSAGDARVRANAVESLWDADAAGVRALLWGVLADSDNRVVGNALLGLYRMGEISSIAAILKMVGDSRDLFRATAAWVMGQTGDPRFQTSVTSLIRDTAVVRATAFRALRSLNQAKARLAAAPALHIRGWRIRRSPEREEVLITLALQSESEPDQTISGLSPTAFILYDDTTLISNYEVSEVTRTGPLSLAVLLPCTGGKEDRLQAAYVQGIETAWPRRTKTVRWLIARYRSTAAEGRPGLGWGGNGLLKLTIEEPAEAGSPALSPQLGFLTDPELVSQAVRCPPDQGGGLQNAAQALQAVIRAAQNSQAPQIILLLPSHPDGFSEDFLAEAELAISSLKASFHALSVGPAVDPVIQSLCQKSGGYYLLVANPGELPQLLEDFVVSLGSSYRISFPARPGAVKIQVFGDRGYGSLQLT
jgi:HEAT repeat protein